MTTSGVLDHVSTWGNAPDRIGNLDALRGLATQYEDEARTIRSAATAAGLVTWLANSAGSDNDLPPSTDPDAVHVLTYHRAKGLEWPMVVLIDLDSDRRPSAFGFHVEASDELDVWEPLKGRWVRFWPVAHSTNRRSELRPRSIPLRAHRARSVRPMTTPRGASASRWRSLCRARSVGRKY